MYGCASMYGRFGALHPCSANMLRMLRCHVLRYQAVWSPPLFTACVSVTCVACACSWGWATHGLLIVISTGVPWVSCRDPPVCSRCPGSMASVAERQLVLCWVVLRCGVWWCVVHVVVWIVSSLRFVMCPLAPLLDMVTAVALSILRDTSHHSWLISLADTTDVRLWMLQLLLLINTSDSACCSFTRLNLTFGTAHHHSGFEDLQCFLQRLDFLLSGCCTVGVRDVRVHTSVCTPILFVVCPESSSSSELTPRGLVVPVFVQILLVDLHTVASSIERFRLPRRAPAPVPSPVLVPLPWLQCQSHGVTSRDSFSAAEFPRATTSCWESPELLHECCSVDLTSSPSLCWCNASSEWLQMGTSVRLTRFVTDDLSRLMVFSCCTRRFTPMTCIKLFASSCFT